MDKYTDWPLVDFSQVVLFLIWHTFLPYMYWSTLFVEDNI